MLMQVFLEGWGLHGVVGIMEWFTVHHVVDLKGMFVYSSLINSKKNLNDSTFRTGWLSVIRSDSQPVRNVSFKFFLELLKKE